MQELISSLGFPIAIALYFVYENKKQTDKYVELAKQAAIDSAASTEAIKQATGVIQKNTEVVEKNTQAFMEFSKRLS